MNRDESLTDQSSEREKTTIKKRSRRKRHMKDMREDNEETRADESLVTEKNTRHVHQASLVSGSVEQNEKASKMISEAGADE